MPGNPRDIFRDAELDPELLSTPFRVQTNWHVITGTSCSGKTTLIDQLAKNGFQTVPEVARKYFEREFGKGRTIDEIRQDRATLTRQLYDLMVRSEQGLRSDEFAFLDRGLPDALVFYRYAGMNPNEILTDCIKNRYASVFMLDRLPYQRDGVRVADDITAAYYDAWMSCDYSALGYNIVRVPVLLPEERLAFVLERLSEQGLL
jgi:predicted ATPase